MRLMTTLLHALLAGLAARPHAACCAYGIHWANFR